MKLFNLDCHISVIEDLKHIFTELGHSVESWSISGHNWVFNRNPVNTEIINSSNWRNLTPEMCDLFYERYKDELSKYDGFICTYPLTFSLLYEKFNKPIILHIPIRYETPFENDKEKWLNFNNFLIKGIDNKKIFPIANSQYDKKYFEFFINRECGFIPNICDYTKTQWNPKLNKFLYYSRLNIHLDDNLIVNKNSLGKYSWEELSEYKGIITIPYNCSTMSLFEFYTSNIPIFCPSVEFMIELYNTNKSSVLSEITWNQVFNKPPGSIIPCDINNDPNRYDNLEIMSNWIKLSDFYNEDSMPYIVYFDSFDDMYLKLLNTDLENVSNKMKEFNKIKKNKIYNEWNKILNLINE
jgi:hypothetical protein